MTPSPKSGGRDPNLPGLPPPPFKWYNAMPLMLFNKAFQMEFYKYASIQTCAYTCTIFMHICAPTYTTIIACVYNIVNMYARMFAYTHACRPL